MSYFSWGTKGLDAWLTREPDWDWSDTPDEDEPQDFGETDGGE